MSIFTKEQRHEIYIRAKYVFQHNRQLYSNPGICACIIQAVYELQMNPFGISSIAFLVKDSTHFPELFTYKPANKSNYEFWWNTRYKKVRLEVFDKIIAETT